MAFLFWGTLSLIVLLFLTSLNISTVNCDPPEPVIQCMSKNTNCTVTNGYGIFPDRTLCRVAAAAYPSTESELIKIVSRASQSNQKMKVVTRYSHSIPKISCPGGPDGAGLVVSTLNLNRVVDVNLESSRMTFESGIALHDLIEAAAKHGLTLPYTPYWLGVTLGGLLGTGAHGSSFHGKGSAVHEYVVGMRVVVPTDQWVDGAFAEVIEIKEDEPELLAAKVSLGVLGVISQVTLQLQPMFKRSLTYQTIDDSGLEDEIEKFAEEVEFGDIAWYPSENKAVFRHDIRVPMSQEGDAENDFTGFRPQLPLLMETLRRTEEALEATRNSEGKCVLGRTQLGALMLSGYGLKNNKNSLLSFTGYPIIGKQNKIQAAGSCLKDINDDLLTVCGWDPRIHGEFFFQTAISIPMSKISNFIQDVKKLRDMDSTSLCGVNLYYGFYMRFVRNSTAFLGKTFDVVDIDITYYRDHDPNQPRLHEDVYEEIEQMSIFKYGGLPHWGKNRNVGFIGVSDKYKGRVEEFVKVMKRFDPKGLFSSEWTDSLLGLEAGGLSIDRPGCALEGLCICSHDSHCAPKKHYYCRAGRVFKQARVCRHESPSFRDEL